MITLPILICIGLFFCCDKSFNCTQQLNVFCLFHIILEYGLLELINYASNRIINSSNLITISYLLLIFYHT
nr:MAG TPA: hypothetical protein [Caudoviricetes sp.]